MPPKRAPLPQVEPTRKSSRPPTPTKKKVAFQTERDRRATERAKAVDALRATVDKKQKGRTKKAREAERAKQAEELQIRIDLAKEEREVHKEFQRENAATTERQKKQNEIARKLRLSKNKQDANMFRAQLEALRKQDRTEVRDIKDNVNPDNEFNRRDDKNDDIIATWPYVIQLHWKAFLNKALIHSDRVRAVERQHLKEKKEIAKIEAIKKIDAAADGREYEIQSRLAMIQSQHRRDTKQNQLLDDFGTES
jgi:hypothetical protein